MFRLMIALAFFILLPEGDSGDPMDTLTTETLVKRHGYLFENHTVQTEDGYILSIHRIPHSASRNHLNPSPVAFLMHCLLCSSSDWVVVGPGNALAYILHDAGYDVWLGNARGNTYSRKHVKYNPEKSKFWKFSWHEIGVYDLPAMIDYIRSFTGVDQLRYFGVSQGTTVFLVLNSMKPDYNKLFKSAFLLAPIAFLGTASNEFMRLGSDLITEPSLASIFLQNTEFRPSKEQMSTIGELLCSDASSSRVLCENIYFLVTGFNEDTVNSTIIPDLMASNPAGSSMNQFLHFAQGYRSGCFRQFDHGFFGNFEAYGTAKPPKYPLNKIKTPIFLYYSLSDSFSSKKDVLKLSKKLQSVVRIFENPIRNFDHLAHLYAANISQKVYKFVMEDLASVD